MDNAIDRDPGHHPTPSLSNTDLLRANTSVDVPSPLLHRPPLPPGGLQRYAERPIGYRPAAPCMDLPHQTQPGAIPPKLITEFREKTDEESVPEEDRRVTVWNPTTGKKLSGNASPFRRNLHKYLAAHPEWEECPDAGENKKRRKPCSSQPGGKRARIEEYDQFSCPLYLWECLIAVAHAHSQAEEEWKGPIENIPSPSTPVTIPCRFTLSTAG